MSYQYAHNMRGFLICTMRYQQTSAKQCTKTNLATTNKVSP